uniref:Si:dkey-219c3.2 n=1 Tax=Nothobranchius furzeri TaxID=105023 RepID=A0A8C6PL63_NOTFU
MKTEHARAHTLKMAGASDPLEDVLSDEVDQKAVSDLVGSLESQLGDRKTPAGSYTDENRDAAAAAAEHFSGKVFDQVGSAEQPQQGHPNAGSTREPVPGQALPPSSSPGLAGAVNALGTILPAAGVPLRPGPVTLSPQLPATASFHRTPVLGPSAAPSVAETIRTSSPGLQGLNGSTGAGKLASSPGGVSAGSAAVIGSIVTQPGVPAPQSPVTTAAQNGLEPKAAPCPSASQVLNHSNPLMHTKGLVAGQPPSGSSVILTSTPPPAPSQSPIIQVQTGTSTPPAGVKPAINGVVQPAVAVVRSPLVPVEGAASIQQQRPGLVASATRATAPQPGLAVRPQQQATIQLPPGTVLFRTETGQLLVLPQQLLAQAKMQQGQTAVTQRPAASMAAPTIRVSTATTVSWYSHNCLQNLSPAGSLKLFFFFFLPSLSSEMQENVKKCKNFLATLIKLTPQNSTSPETSKNVKALVQDLLDAKIEPEEFTSRLQAELKSSPQPCLVPFLKKSLPALRQTLLNSQQSSATAPPITSATPAATTTTTIIRPQLPGSAVAGRPGVQPIQTHSPVVISQPFRHQGEPGWTDQNTPVAGIQLVTGLLMSEVSFIYRDDDDINDVASMAGVNLNEENARILATSSELVGTKIQSCKDEYFLPPVLLHRRILDTAKRLGVTEVPLDVVNLVSHAAESRLRSLLEKVSIIAQHRSDGGKDEERYEQTSDVRSQLRFFEQLERMEKQRKDEQEREILLKAAKSRARQEDPEQVRLKQKAKEMQQQELAQMRQRDANLTALAAIGPRKKRKMDSGDAVTGGGEVRNSGVASGSGSCVTQSPRQQLRQRITRVNLRDFIFCLEQDRSSARSLTLYKALLK